jgi:sarcosine oxidase subunit delta
MHDHGCRRWFNALRNTVSDAFLATYEMGRTRPTVDVSGPALASARKA